MVTAIIQARMCSTRLPYKTLMEIEGKPLLWHLLDRIKEASLVDNIVIATTFNPKDKAILEFSKRHGIPAFQGDENDVLDRMYQAAKKSKADTIVRVTPDCPLLCPRVLDKVVAEFLKGGYDYVTNTLLYTYPDGCDVEVFSFKALERAWKECKDAVMREHVTSYFINSGKFKMKNVENKAPVDPRDYKWSVDRIEDLKFVKEVFRHLYGKKKPFFYEDVMNLLKKYPELRNINREAIMNEGYYKSILKSPVVKPKKLKITRSLALKKEAETLIPGCSQTFSKGPTQFVQGVAPVFVEKGSGAHVWDVDGNKYLDYSMAMGPVILGHNYPAVSEAAKRQIDLGNTFTLPHRSEVELARMLRQIIPCAEMVRFGKNGSDATSSAVRVARAYTGRDIIACCYDEATEILTKDGFKKFKDLGEKEIVATLNPNTNYLEYKQIERKIKYHFADKIIHFKGQRVDLIVTPDHKIYRKFRLKKGHHFKLVEASSAMKKKIMTQMTSICKWKGKTEKEIIISRITDQRHPTKGISSFSTKDFVKFMGWYLSEGYVVEQKRGRYEVGIAQDKKNSKNSREIFSTIKKMGFRPYRNGHHICFNSKELVQYLKQFGKCKDKYIPDWIKELPPDYLSIFVEAMIKGDGTFENGRMRKFYSTSIKLIDGMQELLLKMGYSTTISKYKNTGFSKHKIYHLNIGREDVLGSWPKEEYYDGYVYCVTVPNHIILVRRNGKIVWSGNCGYHGWQDWYVAATTRSKGIPDAVKALTLTFEYNNIESLEKIFRENENQVACVIMEPVGVVEPKDNFLAKVKEITHKNKAILIFDEVVTGFRLSLGGAQEYFHVTPDIGCFGKAMGNGFPISTVVGRRDMMKLFEEVFCSFTFGGEAVSIAASIATIKELKDKNAIKHLWEQGRRLRDGYNILAKEHGMDKYTQCIGLYPHTVITFKDNKGEDDLLLKSLFQQECLKRGILFTGSHNITFSHTKGDIDYTLRVYNTVLKITKEAIAKNKVAKLLEGKPVRPVFRKA